MTNEININGFRIGNGRKPFIIAEACINHEGEIDKAKKMIEIAKNAGADCIKFQLHHLENEMLKTTPKSDNFDESLWDALDRTNFTISEHIELKKYCEQLNIIYLCTPFSRDSVDALEDINVSFYKIGSGELTNLPLIEYVAKKKKPMIVSTGMSTLSEIEETVSLIKSVGTDFGLTHCVSAYPCPHEIMNIGVIKILQDKFDVPVGLSDHTSDIFSALGAVAYGACILEKHFTLDKTAAGPDHASSIEANELSMLVKGAEAIHKANGSKKTIFEQEKQIIAWARESVVSETNIKSGEILTLENIWVKRPGPEKNGIPAKSLSQVLGKRASKDIKKDTQLKWTDIN